MDIVFKQAVHLLQDIKVFWAVCGGWAIDFFLNLQTREHKDLDITIKRQNQLHVQANLLNQGWTLNKVHSGELYTWEQNEYLELPVHNVWCSHPDLPPHYLEILFSETNDTHYKFRRNQQIQRSLEQAFLPTVSGIQILAPEIVLLFKAKYSDDQPTYQQDFERTLPKLTAEQKQWLIQALIKAYGSHAWLNVLL